MSSEVPDYSNPPATAAEAERLGLRKATREEIKNEREKNPQPDEETKARSGLCYMGPCNEKGERMICYWTIEGCEACWWEKCR